MTTPPISHFEYTLPVEKNSSLKEQDLYKIAESYKEYFKDGFEWHCLSKILLEMYAFLLQNKHLSHLEIKEKIIVILNHFIDITDTPYLPDEYTDPIFKSLMPAFIDLLEQFLSGISSSVPSIESQTPTKVSLAKFISNLKETFTDGFQLHDIPVCIKASIDFMGCFPFLKKEEKHKCVVSIIDSLIDSSHTGGPNFIVHPIIKRIVHPFIDDIFTTIHQ